MNEDIARAVMKQVLTTNSQMKQDSRLIDNYVDDFYSFGEGDWAAITQDELIKDFTIYVELVSEERL